ncbi:MAG: GIY-YIG nuclease family protein [Magnetococcales bacterium]|nr:GIY-YIG nuclease family protein [Magnetococcales bacterium]
MTKLPPVPPTAPSRVCISNECLQKNFCSHYSDVEPRNGFIAAVLSKYPDCDPDKGHGYMQTIESSFVKGFHDTLFWSGFLDDVKKVKKQKQKPGYIYVAYNPAIPDMVKIGVSMDVADRMKGLSRSHPFKFEVLYEKFTTTPYAIETECRKRLAEYNVLKHKGNSGREWFNCSPENVVNTVTDILSQGTCYAAESTSIAQTAASTTIT